MAESYLRQSALAHLGLEGRAGREAQTGGVTLGERSLPGIVDLRGDAEPLAAAFEPAMGFALPKRPNTTVSKGKPGAKTRFAALCLGPDQWWVVGADGPKLAAKLAEALDGQPASVTEVGESRACIHVTGPHARDLLAKGCPLDLHPRVFNTGDCAQGMLAKAGVLIHQVDDAPAYDIYVLRSFAEYLWLWLEDAAREYGLVVAPA